MDLEPIERHVRERERIDVEAHVVVRGGPLTVEAILRNADSTQRRYQFVGAPLVAVSVELTLPGWDLDRILSCRRMRTRRTYAAVRVAAVLEAGYRLLPTFDAPHCSVILASYTREAAEGLLELLGGPTINPHFMRRKL